MLEAIDDIVPIGNPDWERVWDRHNTRYPQKDRTAESLRRKFQTLVKKKMKTGDPNCPPHIRSAKRIYRKIVEATDGSDGKSNKEKDDDDDEDDRDDDDDEVEEGDSTLEGKKNDDEVEDDDRDPSVFPLATPLIAGPGAIATIILLTNEAQGNLLQQISVIVVMGAVVLTAFILFMLAGLMERALGQRTTHRKSGVEQITGSGRTPRRPDPGGGRWP